MKYSLAPSNYTFNATAKTITFSGTVPADINNIMHVANITRGVIYFQPQAGPLFSGTYSSPTLTLAASTTGHANGDKLLIVYDDGAATVPVVTDVQKGGGAITASTTRVTLATDGPGVASLSNIDTKTPALQSGGVPITDNAGSLTVDGKAYRSTVTITRPSNTTAYTAGDVVGDTGGSAILTLTNIGPSGGMVLIQSAALIFSDSTVISGMGAFRIHLYSASPTAIADNAPFDLVSGERANYMGFIDLPAPLDLGSTLYTQADSVGRLVKLASASTTLFAEIETRGAYTPASGSTIELRMSTMEAGL